MSSISVHLQVPEFIESGLASGSMERVGGVIRTLNSNNKESIAWIRKAGQTGQTVVSSAGLLENVMRFSGLGTTTLATLLGSSLPILNIAMAGYALADIILRIQGQHAELGQLHEAIKREFNRERVVNLITAIDIARNISRARDVDVKRQMVGQVTERLVNAEVQLLIDFEESLTGDMEVKHKEAAVRTIVLAMHVAAMSARAWLEIHEFELACEWLTYSLERQQQRARRQLHNWLGQDRAYFFHKSVGDENFERYLRTERWIRGKKYVLRELVRENYVDFWNDDALSSIQNPPRFGRREAVLITPPPYLSLLKQVELLIENYRRLEGFRLELKSMCLPFDQWDVYDVRTDMMDTEHGGYVMLVNDALFGRASQTDA